MAQRVLKDAASFCPPVSAGRGGGEICHAEVGGVDVDRLSFLAEELAKLREGREVAALGESGEAEGTPGPGDDQPASGGIGAGERSGRMLAVQESARMARTVAVITSADAATMVIRLASARAA